MVSGIFSQLISILISRTCNLIRSIADETKDLMKKQFNLTDDIGQHLEYQRGYPSCQIKGKNFILSEGVINSTNESVNPEFKTVWREGSIMMKNLITGDFIKDYDFCVQNDGSIWNYTTSKYQHSTLIAKACTLPCLGRLPCLR